ncbi:MAG TPA: glycosyl hydrolase family 17 protein [Anaerolineaceae bacterium]|nr:glycosyl hydrolase family 17 protein [Anaerolineaceae bacterium]HPN51136.1 glycosyl hydrolase family 17 protein [Anaerolineaceae bacterium]
MIAKIVSKITIGILLFTLLVSLTLSQVPVIALARPADQLPLFLPLVPGPVKPYQLDGLNFSPYMDGQNPDFGSTISEVQLRERMTIIAPYTRWIRSFGCGNGLEKTGQIAHELGLKSASSAWISRDALQNQAQIDCLIQQANAGQVDMAVVGSETLIRGDVSSAELISYLQQVRQAIPATIPVTTADVYSSLLEHPEVATATDIVFANIYPFWEGYPVTHSVAVLDDAYRQLAAAFPSQTIMISETGWPSCGELGQAVGSVENVAQYFSQVAAWAKENKVSVFYFDAFDEAWKTAKEGPQGACWGLWDKDGNMKPGIQSIFAGAAQPLNQVLPLTCDTTTFSFQFTYVPPIGSFDNVTGKACGVFNKQARVVLWIYAWGGWWVKPYGNQPLTAINPDGSWQVDYTTGGVDETATAFKAYLIPPGVDPFGNMTGYPMIEVQRNP